RRSDKVGEFDLVDAGAGRIVMQRRIGMRAAMGRHPDAGDVDGTSRADGEGLRGLEQRIARKDAHADPQGRRDIDQAHYNSVLSCQSSGNSTTSSILRK